MGDELKRIEGNGGEGRTKEVNEDEKDAPDFLMRVHPVHADEII